MHCRVSSWNGFAKAATVVHDTYGRLLKKHLRSCPKAKLTKTTKIKTIVGPG